MTLKEIKRKIKRAHEEVLATIEIAKYTSIKEALNTFRAKIDIQIMCRNGFKETDPIKNRLLKKHKTMFDYIDRKYKDWWENYKFSKLSKPSEKRNIIWLCWWQGLENAPVVVKKCIDSIKNNCGDAEIIIITEENLNDYVSFPEHILTKVKSGIISKTFFSDLLRLNLLSKYGGVWLDATFYCINSISDINKLTLWSIKRPEYFHASPACGYFAGYSMGCDDQNRWIFKATLDFLYYYWEKNNKLVDYLLMGYTIACLKRRNPFIQAEFERIQPNNKNCDELFKIFSQPYDEKTWNNIKKDTSLFKLSWKNKYALDVDGKPTFYAKFLNGELT